MGTRTEELQTENQNHPESVQQLNNQNVGESLDHLRYESRRLETFNSWPANAKVGANKIAKAGFYYTGSYLEVKCLWCGCSLANWEYGDQVMARHRRSQPDCPFVLNLSNNIPLSPSPMPPSPLITPQTSQVDSSQSSSDVTDNDSNQTQEVQHGSEQETSISSTENVEPLLEGPDTASSDENPSSSSSSSTETPAQEHGGSTSEELFPQYFCEEKRFKTFRSWPIAFINPGDLAKSGFIYCGVNDCVRCVFCLGYVASWEPTDVPHSVHAQLFPSCRFVQGIDCGNRPMSLERRDWLNLQSLSQDVSYHRPQVSSYDNSAHFGYSDLFDMLGGASDVSEDPLGGYDETGIRPRARDMNSGPEKGPSVLTLKDPSKVGEERVEDMIGVIKHYGPVHSKYATIEARLRTFRDWPPGLKQQPKDLAESGFYYMGLSDQVKCFYCDGGLRNWQPEDDPWVEHSRWFCKCGFIRLVKGDEFIAESIASKPPETLPEVPSSSSRDRPKKMTDEILKSMMSSIEVQEALSCGIDPTRIRVAIRKKWEESGTGFAGSKQLIEAAFRAQHRQEERASAENNSSQSPFADMKPETMAFMTTTATSGAETISAASLATATTSVTAPIAEKCVDEDTSSKSLDLERENRRLKEERTCKICMDNPIGVVFLPCGHLICCFQCAPALTTCPLCRQAICGTVKTYMS